MERDAWFAARARETLATLPPTAITLLAADIGPGGASEVGLAARVAHVWALLSGGHDSDAVAALFGRLRVFGPAAEDVVLRQFVLPVRDKFRAGDVPFPNRWAPAEIFADLLLLDYQQQFCHGVEETALRTDLTTRWGLRDETLEQFWGWARCRVHALGADPFGALPADALNVKIVSIVRSELFAAAVAEEMAGRPPELAELDEAGQLARFLVTLAGLEAVLTKWDAAGAADLLDRVRELHESVAESVRGLSGWERSLLGLQSDDDRVVRHDVRKWPRVSHVSNSGINALPDRVGGRWEVPDWVEEWVFSAGARSGHEAYGPTAYFFLVLEPGDGHTFDAIVQADPRQDGAHYEIPFGVRAAGEDLMIGYHFWLTDPYSRFELAWLSLVEHVRFDVLQIVPSEAATTVHAGLAVRHSTAISLSPTLRQDIARVVADALRAEPVAPAAADADSAEVRFEPDAKAPFLAAERAKGERVQAELAEHLGLPASVDPAFAADLSEAKSAMYRMLVHRAELFAIGQAALYEMAARSVEPLEREVLALRQRLRRDVRRESDATAGDLAAVLGDSGRAFIHLARQSDALVARWCRLGPAGAEFGTVELGLVGFGLANDPDRLVSLFHEWQTVADGLGRRRALDGLMAEVGEHVMGPIYADLRGRGVTRVVFSPSSELDGVPFHCAPVRTGAGVVPACEAFAEFTYAPSLRVLAQLARLGPVPPSSGVIIAHDTGRPPMLSVYDEAADIERLHPGCRVLTGDDATPAKALAAAAGQPVVHLACHGEGVPGDLYCAGLHLSGASRRTGFLSAARVLAEGDFRGVGLVTLSACRTAASSSPPLSLHDYSGLDAAFLSRGARCVVSTLWPVDDEVARQFMRAFYTQLFGGASVADAHRRAVELLRNGAEAGTALTSIRHRDLVAEGSDDEEPLAHPLAHPLYWGAFRCFGRAW